MLEPDDLNTACSFYPPRAEKKAVLDELARRKRAVKSILGESETDSRAKECLGVIAHTVETVEKE